jgi:hypothetical protein
MPGLASGLLKLWRSSPEEVALQLRWNQDCQERWQNADGFVGSPSQQLI